ncbi:hypothetical protein PO124_28020 [Bacillus licheniformis]|nr:hypothetical protein [Bacillus licheniformis]
MKDLHEIDAEMTDIQQIRSIHLFNIQRNFFMNWARSIRKYFGGGGRMINYANRGKALQMLINSTNAVYKQRAGL